MLRTPTVPGLLLVAAMLLAACGGSPTAEASDPSIATATASGGGVDEQPGASASNGSVVPDPATTPSGGEPGAGTGSGGADIAIKGDRSFTISSAGVCNVSTLTGAEDYSVSFETEGEDLWVLSIDIRAAADDGSYEVVDSTIVGKAEVSLSDLMGGGADSIAGGTVTLADGGTSGTIDATLEGESGRFEVGGTFTCTMG